jgi:hypothetical protein
MKIGAVQNENKKAERAGLESPMKSPGKPMFSAKVAQIPAQPQKLSYR